MDLNNKKIGIWGFGVVGQSAARFVNNFACQVQIMDKKTPTPDQQQWLADHMISFVIQSPDTISSFLQNNDYILPSPGININPYWEKYTHKWLCELDLFAIHFKKPIIAITGSVGKTSITTLLGGLLKKLGGPKIGSFPLIGGNIGTCSLDFVVPSWSPITNIATDAYTPHQSSHQHTQVSSAHTHDQLSTDSLASTPNSSSYNHATSAILEVSSFQVAYTKQFAPHLAIITNFSPNHLDWHGTLDHYLHAKLNIYSHQTATDYALVPYELHKAYTTYQHHMPPNASTKNCADNTPSTHPATPHDSYTPTATWQAMLTHSNIPQPPPHVPQALPQLFLFSTHTISINEQASLAPHITLFYLQDNIIIRYHNQTNIPVYSLTHLPPITCAQNWLIIIAALTILGLPLTHIHEHVTTLSLPPHRLEKVITPPHYPIAIYNDSKSTTPAATLNALQTLTGKPTHLFLGGLSKGIDREPLIAALQDKVKKVYCFGAEHARLAQLCTQYQIPHEAFATLEGAVHTCLTNALPNEQIIFSPAGSSYDLFQHYEDRGDQFKQMITLFLQKLT